MEETILEFIQGAPNLAYLVVYGVLLLCGLGLPLPEDITLVAGGYTVYLAQESHLKSPKLLPMIIVGFLGVMTGDIILFMAGRKLGPKVMQIWPFKHLLSPARLERVQKFFKHYGAWTAFVARFAAGLRAPTYLLAGTAKMKFRIFLAADGSAAALSVPLLVWLSYHFGSEIGLVKKWLMQSKYAVGGVLLLTVLFFVVRKFQQPKAPLVEESQKN